MKANKILKEIIIATVVVVPLLYYFYLWNSLPAAIPIHFDAVGNPNNYGSKTGMLWLLLFLTVGVYILLLFVPQLDPKKNFQNNIKTYFKIRLLLTVFFSVISFIIILSVKESKFNTSYFFAVIALLFAVIGNYLTIVGPNNFLGIKTPWTKESESNWRKTHLLVGRLMFFSGVILAVLVFILPHPYKFPVFVSCVSLIVIIPILYSYFLYRKSNKKGKNIDSNAQINDQNSGKWYGNLYYNPKDSRVLLPKRFGIGWSFNFGNPYTYVVIVVIVGLIVLVSHIG